LQVVARRYFPSTLFSPTLFPQIFLSDFLAGTSPSSRIKKNKLVKSYKRLITVLEVTLKAFKGILNQNPANAGVGF
jgi:hypothetical protein